MPRRVLPFLTDTEQTAAGTPAVRLVLWALNCSFHYFPFLAGQRDAWATGACAAHPVQCLVRAGQHFALLALESHWKRCAIGSHTELDRSQN